MAVAGANENPGGGEMPNVAVTLAFEFMTRTQAPVPEQSPLHPVKVDPFRGVAVRFTVVWDE